MSRGVGPKVRQRSTRGNTPSPHRLPTPCPHVGHGSTAAHNRQARGPARLHHCSHTTCTRLDGCPAGHTGSLHRSPNPAPSGFIHVSRNLSPLVVLSRCVCTVHCPSPRVTPACVAPLVSTVHVLATVQGSLTVHAQTARTHHSAQRVFSTRRTVTVCA